MKGKTCEVIKRRVKGEEDKSDEGELVQRRRRRLKECREMGRIRQKWAEIGGNWRKRMETGRNKR